MKKIILGLMTLMSTSSFAAEVCVIFPANFGVVSSCSNVDNGAQRRSEKATSVFLKDKLNDGFKIQSTQISKDDIVIYTLVKT